MIGLPTEVHTHTTKIAPFLNPITGREPNNAHNHGNAEVLDFAREADGAQDTMDVKELHSQTKLQVSLPIAEK